MRKNLIVILTAAAIVGGLYFWMKQKGDLTRVPFDGSLLA